MTNAISNDEAMILVTEDVIKKARKNAAAAKPPRSIGKRYVGAGSGNKVMSKSGTVFVLPSGAEGTFYHVVKPTPYSAHRPAPSLSRSDVLFFDDAELPSSAEVELADEFDRVQAKTALDLAEIEQIKKRTGVLKDETRAMLNEMAALQKSMAESR